MAKVYRSICNEIDELHVHILDVIEKYIKMKVDVESELEKGYYNLAKARYIMGSQCVSTLQLPTADSNPVRPVATVCRFEKQNHYVFRLHSRIPCPIKPQEDIEKTAFKIDTTRADVVQDMLQSDVHGLRRRRDVVAVDDESYFELKENMLDEVSSKASTVSTLESCIDPIRMFGILVPHTLRVAQGFFTGVLKQLLNCATMQTELDACLKQYKHLLNVKNLIEVSTLHRDINIYDDSEYWYPSVTSSVAVSETSEELVKVPSPTPPSSISYQGPGQAEVCGEYYVPFMAIQPEDTTSENEIELAETNEAQHTGDVQDPDNKDEDDITPD